MLKLLKSFIVLILWMFFVLRMRHPWLLFRTCIKLNPHFVCCCLTPQNFCKVHLFIFSDALVLRVVIPQFVWQMCNVHLLKTHLRFANNLSPTGPVLNCFLFCETLLQLIRSPSALYPQSPRKIPIFFMFSGIHWGQRLDKWCEKGLT